MSIVTDHGTVDIFSLKKETILINLKNISVVSKDNEVYKGLYASCRLLSLEELLRMNTIKDESPHTHDSIEVSVFENCLINFIGLDKEEVDFDRSDAGLIPRVANAIILKSVNITLKPLEKIEEYTGYVTILETMAATVSRYMNIPYPEVINFPVNIITKYFAICRVSFPNDIKIKGDEIEE